MEFGLIQTHGRMEVTALPDSLMRSVKRLNIRDFLTQVLYSIRSRWAEHLSELLNHINATDPFLVNQLPQFPILTDLDTPPAFHEVAKAVKGLKNNKAAGPDGIPAEVFKHGGYPLLHRLHYFISAAWGAGELPQQWKDAITVIVYKRKGDRSECGNSRGISLLSVAGKVLARIMLDRLLSHVVDTLLPESQCGFRRNRSTHDMIFVTRLLQEKCREQSQNLFVAFIDLTKAFDTVNRQLLWGILSKFGCPPQFLTVLRAFHDGMTASVLVDGQLSEPFEVLVGVKQGCVLAPVIFNLFLVAVTLIFRSKISEADGIPINYRLDGSLFNLRRLQAKTKSSHDIVFELQYADDAALPSHSTDGLQRNLNMLTDTYQRAGLAVNTKKTEVMAQTTGTRTPVTPQITVHGATLSNVSQFIYLGSLLSHDNDLTHDIQRRINLSSAAFGRFSQRVFYNKNLTISTKIAVYHAICVSTLLYGCESWVPYRRHIRALEAHHIRSLQKILGLRWWHRITHVEIRRRASSYLLEYFLLLRQLRWLGHVIRLLTNRLPRRVLYGELLHGKRHRGAPKKRYSDHIKATLKKCNIPFESLESLAADRSKWKDTCKAGLDIFLSYHNLAAADRRERRHRQRSATVFSSARPCPTCGRVCASDFGLRSHMRVHNCPP